MEIALVYIAIPYISQVALLKAGCVHIFLVTVVIPKVQDVIKMVVKECLEYIE